MYTRKTYYPRKFKRSLNGVKFNQVATKITRAEISRIAKKAVEKSSELKRNYQSYIQTLVNNVAYVTNVTAALNQGVTNNEIIGTEFHLKRIRFRVRIDLDASISAWGGQYRLMLFKSTDGITTGTTSAPPLARIFQQGGTNFIIWDQVDPEFVTPLYDHSGAINVSAANASPTRFVEFTVPYDRMMRTKGENANYLKDGTIYLLFGMSRVDGALVTAGAQFLSAQIEYFDS